MNENFDAFDKYVMNYDMDEKMINYKYNHSYRVVHQAEEICRSLEMDTIERDLASNIALLHDIARFRQWTDYKTFKDSESFDHGDEGVKILFDEGEIKNFIIDKDDYEVVKKAVAGHNKYDLDYSDMTDREALQCKIVRDADKIDIIIETSNSVKNPNVRIDEHVINNFKNHELVANEAGDTDFLYVIREIAFFFDINYKRSMEILLEHDLLNKKLNLIRSDINKDQVDLIEKELKKYIKERFDIEC